MPVFLVRNNLNLDFLKFYCICPSWTAKLTFFVSPELSSVRDYVITHSVCSMCMCMYVVFCKIDHCIHIHWCIVMGLGHNDPWVESHLWPQQTWGQRSSRGQWPSVQVFGKKGQCIHIFWCFFKSNITMVAKVCDRESRRDMWFENRLVLIWYCYVSGFMCFIERETWNFILKLREIFPWRETVFRAHGMNKKIWWKAVFLSIYVIF